MESIDMDFVVAGLGSMGKRRVRCLQALGYKGIHGFDLRADRRKEAEERYGIRTHADIGAALDAARPHALIVSVPPDVHHVYMKAAAERSIHFFVEASVVDTDMEAIANRASAAGVV